jgi:predicted ATP-dependent Lon-type protease
MTSARTVTKACLIIGLASAIGFIPAHAAVQENDTTTIALSVFVPCAAGGAGEIVDLAGPLHTLVTFTISGNTVSGVFHFQPQGIVGAGETTGQTYHATGITEESFKIAFQNGKANSSFVNNFRIIGQSTGNNYLVHEDFHMTFNAAGVLTVTHDNLTIDCK